MSGASTAARRVPGWKIHRALAGEPIGLPVTEFVPPHLWVTSEFSASPKAHLLDWAVAVWMDEDLPQFGARRPHEPLSCRLRGRRPHDDRRSRCLRRCGGCAMTPSATSPTDGPLALGQ